MLIVAAAILLSVLLGALLVIPQLKKTGNSRTTQKISMSKVYKLVLPVNVGSKLVLRSSFWNAFVPKTYTKAEISFHDKRTDCWIIIKDKVFDVTSYVEEHPGGDAILAHAGDDSTEGFFGPQHATRVFDMIDDFYIGDLEH